MPLRILTEYDIAGPLTGGALRTKGLYDALHRLGLQVSVHRLVSDRPMGIRHQHPERELVRRLRTLNGLWLFDGLPLAPLARWCRAPVVIDIRDSWSLLQGASRLNVRLLLALVRRHATGAIYISERDAQADRPFLGRLPVLVVPNGISDSLRDLSIVTGFEPHIAIAADWNYWPNREGIHLLVDALQRLALDLPIHAFGPGDPVVADRTISFHGFTEDLAAIYRDARTVVCPIISGSGVKNKVLEGLAAGRPVVTTREGAQGVPPSSALIVRESVDELADALRGTFLMEAAQLSRLGAIGRDSVSGLTWDRSATSLLRGIETLEGRP